MAWIMCPVCKGKGTIVVVPAAPLVNEQVISCTVCEGEGYLQNWKDTDKVNKKDEKK